MLLGHDGPEHFFDTASCESLLFHMASFSEAATVLSLSSSPSIQDSSEQLRIDTSLQVKDSVSTVQTIY